jgi:hypothetical protein
MMVMSHPVEEKNTIFLRRPVTTLEVCEGMFAGAKTPAVPGLQKYNVTQETKPNSKKSEKIHCDTPKKFEQIPL